MKVGQFWSSTFQEWYAPKASQHMFDPYRSDCHFMMTLIQSVFSRIMSSFAASPFWSWGWSSTCFGAQTTLTTGWVASLKLEVGSYFIVESGSRCWGGVSSRAGSRRRASHTFHMQGQKNICKGKQKERKNNFMLSWQVYGFLLAVGLELVWEIIGKKNPLFLICQHLFDKSWHSSAN